MKYGKTNYIENMLNTKPVEYFIDIINSKLQNSNVSWREIAQAFADARKMYGSESASFKEVMLQTKFTKSSAHKLASIAESKRLEKYKSKLSLIHSWSSLYLIHSLSDEIFNKLKVKFHFDDENSKAQFITVRDINSLKFEPKMRSPFKAFTAIHINEYALRTSKIAGKDLSRLFKLLDEIQNTIPFVKVSNTGINEKYNSIFWKKVEYYKPKIERKFVNNAIDRIISFKPHVNKGENKYEVIFQKSKKKDVINFALEDIEAFMSTYGLEYDGNKIYDEAIKCAYEWFDKKHSKNDDEINPFEFANTDYVSSFIENNNDLSILKQSFSNPKYEQLKIKSKRLIH